MILDRQVCQVKSGDVQLTGKRSATVIPEYLRCPGQSAAQTPLAGIAWEAEHGNPKTNSKKPIRS
jgi:hypothetical protein